jgi:hypothetical protein
MDSSLYGPARAHYKLKPYQLVIVSISDCAPNREIDPWTQVECIPEMDGDCDSEKKSISGWVNSKLLARAHCPKDMN